MKDITQEQFDALFNAMQACTTAMEDAAGSLGAVASTPSKTPKVKADKAKASKKTRSTKKAQVDKPAATVGRLEATPCPWTDEELREYYGCDPKEIFEKPTKEIRFGVGLHKVISEVHSKRPGTSDGEAARRIKKYIGKHTRYTKIDVREIDGETDVYITLSKSDMDAWNVTDKRDPEDVYRRLLNADACTSVAENNEITFCLANVNLEALAV